MAAFYYGSDIVINEETGEEYTRKELIEEGRKVRAEMAAEDLLTEDLHTEEFYAKIDAEMAAAMAENEEAMADTEAVWEDQAMAEVNAQNTVEGREFYTLADLIHAVSGEDTAGMKTTTYRSWAEDLIDSTEAEDREMFYRTGNLVKSLAEYEAWYTR